MFHQCKKGRTVGPALLRSGDQIRSGERAHIWLAVPVPAGSRSRETAAKLLHAFFSLQSGAGDEKAVKVLQVLASQAGAPVLRDVVAYRQSRDALVLPPACFDGLEDVKEERRAFAQRCGAAVADRLASLLK